MTVIVRDLRPDDPEDADAAVGVLRAVLPSLVTTPGALLFTLRGAHPAEHFRVLVAEHEGRVVGVAQTGVAYESSEPGQGYCTPGVQPAHRRLGAGSLLLRTGEEHLARTGAVRASAWADDEPGALAFAARHGYAAGRALRHQHLDLAGAALPGPAAPPPGVELRTGADFAGDPRPLFEADAQATLDEPGDVTVEFADYEHWLTHTWNHPLLDRELTTVAVVGGEVASFTAAHTDRATRYLSGMTGTLRAHRGRGLATLVKADSLRRARAAGFTDAFTSNDDANEPMLAVNRRFGYALSTKLVRHARALG
ncbi:GNAT family N-acetyltransferase [Streptomyces sp. NPDC001941]|uniref:GNAT family N-acetyltransferase n=1 Tax=Streptomyces sp. NPDC001941 TaxID=3154659 RepID=UPI00332CD83C